MDSKELIQELRTKAEKDLLGSVLIRGPRLSELLSLLDSQEKELINLRQREKEAYQETLRARRAEKELKTLLDSQQTKLDEQSKEIERLKDQIEAANTKLTKADALLESIWGDVVHEEIRSAGELIREVVADSKRGGQ